METDWFKNAVVYQIFIDRFSRGKQADSTPVECKGPVFCGGNLRGIIERLDYLVDLGINAIWLSPFNSTAAYHGYHITDFTSVDPHFGTIQILDELIQSAHGRRIRVIMDFVPNHVHKSHPFFKQALENQTSEYRNWFYFDRSNSYLKFLDIDELPKLNLDYPAAAKHVTDAAIYWIERGIDGLRLDHAVGPTHGFWKKFVKGIKSRHPDTVLIGEVFLSGIKWRNLKTINVTRKRWIFLMDALGLDGTSLAMRQYVGTLDGVLDFRVQSLLKKFVATPRWNCPAWLLKALLKRHYKSFPRDFYLPTFLDNHDMSRFLFDVQQDKTRLEKAAEVQFAQNQPPVIYYGTEVGITQHKPTGPGFDYSDLNARQMMVWDGTAQDSDLLRFYKELIREKTSPR